MGDTVAPGSDAELRLPHIQHGCGWEKEEQEVAVEQEEEEKEEEEEGQDTRLQ